MRFAIASSPSVTNAWIVLGFIESRFEYPELRITHDAAVVLVGFNERGSGPAGRHRTRFPVCRAAGFSVDAAVAGID